MGFFDDIGAGWDLFTEGAGDFFMGPDTPDLEKAREEDLATQTRLADKNTLSNSPNQTDQYGNQLEWTYDPVSGKRTQTIKLSPEMQAWQDKSQAFGLGLMDSWKNLGQGLPGVSSGEEYGQRASDAMYNRAAARLDPMWERRQGSLETQLANQGLVPGTEAYTNAMRDLNFGRNDAYSSAMNDSMIFGGQEASRMFGMDSARRGQLFNEQMGIHGAGLNTYGATRPPGTAFGGFMAATPVGGVPSAFQVAQTGYSNKAGQVQGQRDMVGDIYSGVGGLAGGAVGGFGMPGGGFGGGGGGWGMPAQPTNIMGPTDYTRYGPGY